MSRFDEAAAAAISKGWVARVPHSRAGSSSIVRLRYEATPLGVTAQQQEGFECLQDLIFGAIGLCWNAEARDWTPIPPVEQT